MVAQLRAREKPQEHANMDRRGNGINNHHEILKPLKGWKLRLAWAQRSPQPSTRLFLTPPQRSRLRRADTPASDNSRAVLPSRRESRAD